MPEAKFPAVRICGSHPWGREGASGQEEKEAPDSSPGLGGGRVLQRYKKIEIKNKLLARKGREGQR